MAGGSDAFFEGRVLAGRYVKGKTATCGLGAFGDAFESAAAGENFPRIFVQKH